MTGRQRLRGTTTTAEGTSASGVLLLLDYLSLDVVRSALRKCQGGVWEVPMSFGLDSESVPIRFRLSAHFSSSVLKFPG